MLLRIKTAITAGLAAGTLAVLLAPIVALAQPIPPGAIAPSSERIISFTSDITVQSNGTVLVTERIDYNFPVQKHGIIRSLPLRYRDDRGRLLEMPINIHSIKVASGALVPFALERGTEWLDVRIGDPEKTVTGIVSYVIAYEIQGALRYFEDHDELYWNVTGHDWEVPIDRSGATVHLPEAVPVESVVQRCYTGPAGSTAQDCMAGVQGRTVSYAASGPLTVVVGWQPGIVAVTEPVFVALPYYEQHPFISFVVAALLSFFAIQITRRPGVEKFLRATASTSSGSGFDSDSGSGRSGGGAGGGGGKSW